MKILKIEQSKKYVFFLYKEMGAYFVGRRKVDDWDIEKVTYCKDDRCFSSDQDADAFWDGVVTAINITDI